MPPHRMIGGILFYRCPSVCPSICMHKLHENLTFSHYSYTNLVTRLIFGMKAHLLIPRSRSSAKVKVKYQGHVSQKTADQSDLAPGPQNDPLPFPKGEILDSSKRKEFADNNFNLIKMAESSQNG